MLNNKKLSKIYKLKTKAIQNFLDIKDEEKLEDLN